MFKENLREEERHYVSTVFIIADSQPKKILLVHHKKLNKWMPPGGHQEKSENPYETAIRETKEESDIDITEYLPKPMYLDERALSLPVPKYFLEECIDARENQPKHYHLDMIYVVTIPYQEASCQESESNSIGWFTQDEVKKLSTFENVIILVNLIFSDVE